MKLNSFLIVTLFLISILVLSLTLGCVTPQGFELPSNEVEKTEPRPPKIALYWENTTEPHPEREPWSDALTSVIENDLQQFAKAKDIEGFCPRYPLLTDLQKVKAIGELFVAVSYYESAFKPERFYRECLKSHCQYSKGCQQVPEFGYCMKGGHKLDGGIVISRGLMQLSLESAIGNKCKVSVPNDLHDPIKNLLCGHKIMLRQIDRTGLIATSNNYWAVLKPSSTYNKIKEIKERVKKHAPFCN